MECLSDWCHSSGCRKKGSDDDDCHAASALRIPKKAKTFFENPSYVIRFTPPFIHSWVASSVHFFQAKNTSLAKALLEKRDFDWQQSMLR